MQTHLTLNSIQALAIGLLLFGAASVRGQIVYDFSTSHHSWTAAVQSGSGDEVSPVGQFLWGNLSDGSGNAWYTDGVTSLTTGDWSIKTLTSPELTVQNSSVTIKLTHRYNFEFDQNLLAYIDGGQLRYRVDGGNWTLATGFSGVGYNATQIEAFNLAGEASNNDDGWGSKSSGFDSKALITSMVTISGLSAGQTLQLQLRGGWDDFASPSGPDWVIKKVEVTNVVPEPRVYGVACAVGLLGYGLWRRVRRDRPSPKARSASPTATP
jgi:hypothetical protein